MSVKRILLRHEKRQLYFQLPDAWVAEATEGMSFAGSVQAERLARERGFREVELVFEFDTPEFNFAIGL